MKPRYLREHPDTALALLAEVLFERYLGYHLASIECVDVLPYSRERACQLPKTPIVRILGVRARTRTWGPHAELSRAFGSTAWIDIPVEHTNLWQKGIDARLVLPVSLFGNVYEEVEVTYMAGLDPIPLDVVEAVQTLADALQAGDLDEYSNAIPESVQRVVVKYQEVVVD